MNLEDLPWEDVIFTKILNLLEVRDLLNLRKVSKKFQHLINSYLSTLKSLNLSTCHEPSSLSIIIENCQNLETINLAKIDWLQDSHVDNLLQKSRKLKNLNLNYCCNVMLKFDFLANSPCENLVSMKLNGCTITDEMLTHIVGKCQFLETLDLQHCHRLTDRGILTLRLLPKLKLLFVDGCRITERSLAPFRGKVKIDLPQKQICYPRRLNLQV